MKEWIVFILVFLGVAAAVAIPALVFSTAPESYAITNPTEEQMLEIMDGNPRGRVWYVEAEHIMGSTIVEVELNARWYEDERIEDFLDRVGVEYKLIRRGH